MEIPGTNLIPDLFCWTKMGAEAGQPLEAILQRKELERQAGEGVFVWGIGNAIPALRTTRSSAGGALPVLFSPMRAKPRRADVAPTVLRVWLGFRDPEGRVQALPEHILVTSRGGTGKGSPAHFALFCHAPRSLFTAESAALVHDELRNAESGKPLGFSQVTALVRRTPGSTEGQGGGTRYPIACRATLQGPGWAPLALSVGVPAAVAEEITEASRKGDISVWSSFVADLRGRCQKQLPEQRSEGLFEGW